MKKREYLKQLFKRPSLPPSSGTDELIRLENLVKIYDTGALKVMGLKKINLTIHRGEFVAIMGQSGSGKSTLMNILGCLDRPTLGHYYLDGQDTAELSSEELSAIRNQKIGFVFQSFNLISRTSALKNVELPMTYARRPKKERRERAMELLTRVGLGARYSHMPNELSGGQRQRVALARSVCSQSPICLMDEPLSNLDAKLRGQMRNEIRRLQKKLGLTVIYVTHDQVEAMTMADRIVIMKDGVIQQVGKPMELYDHPKNQFVAGFIGSPQMNFFDVKVEGNLAKFKDGNTLALSEATVNKLKGRQGEMILGIRGEDIKLDEQNLGLNQENHMSAVITDTEVMGNENNLYFEFGGAQAVARVSKYEVSQIGDTIDFVFMPSKIHFFDKDTGVNYTEEA